MTRRSESIQQELFGRDDPSAEGAEVYAVLDGASIPDLLDQLYDRHPPFECLYREELTPDMAEVAPYLVRLEANDSLTEWILDRGWGKHWGIFVRSRSEMIQLRHHFRRFVMVHTEEGRPLLFRFYDPRVLRVFLPTCNGGELAQFFGGHGEYVLEAEEPSQLLRCRMTAGKLDLKTIELKED
jgi:hypothetical protein